MAEIASVNEHMTWAAEAENYRARAARLTKLAEQFGKLNDKALLLRLAEEWSEMAAQADLMTGGSMPPAPNLEDEQSG